jgi:hypothetical protein
MKMINILELRDIFEKAIKPHLKSFFKWSIKFQKCLYWVFIPANSKKFTFSNSSPKATN